MSTSCEAAMADRANMSSALVDGADMVRDVDGMVCVEVRATPMQGGSCANASKRSYKRSVSRDWLYGFPLTAYWAGRCAHLCLRLPAAQAC